MRSASRQYRIYSDNALAVLRLPSLNYPSVMNFEKALQPL